MAAAGAVLVKTMNLLAGKIRPGVTTLDLDQAAEKFIRSQGCEPAFKGYRGFPGSICASPNEMIVHGIPGPYKLERGDIISIDIGVVRRRLGRRRRAHVPGRHDHARCAELLAVTEESLFLAVQECRAGNRLGDVSHAVQEHVEAAGFSIVRSLVGHGVGRSMHEDPQVPNYGTARHRRAARGRDGARGRADGDRSAGTRSAWATTTGRSSPRTARSQPISSSRSRSRRSGPRILTPWHEASGGRAAA